LAREEGELYETGGLFGK
jgi:hypothetical protein